MKSLLNEMKKVMGNVKADEKPHDALTILNTYFFEINNLIRAELLKHLQPNTTNEKLEKIGKEFKNLFFPRVSEIISNEITNNLSDFWQTDNVDFLMKMIECNCVVFLMKPETQEQYKHLLNSFSPPETLELTIADINSYLLFNLCHELIRERFKKEVISFVTREVDENGDTLLHQACRKGNFRLLRKLISYKWDPFDEKTKDPIKIAQESGCQEIVAYLESLKQKPQAPKGSMGMITMMGAAASPAAKISVTRDGFCVTPGSFSAKIQQNIRPASVSDERGYSAITPGGSFVYPTWDIIIDIDKPEDQRKAVTVFLDEKKAGKNIAVQRFVPSSPPISLPKNTKLGSDEIVAHITKERLDRWMSLKARYRNQFQTMSASAISVVETAGFLTLDDDAWQWCHIFAFSLGGIDGILPSTPQDFDNFGPQREQNLVIGTKEANAHMLVVENLVRNLILYKGIPELFIKAKPFFVNGLEEHHIAETITYTIQDALSNPRHQITFSFEMLSRRKTALQEPEVIGPIIEQLFLSNGVELGLVAPAVVVPANPISGRSSVSGSAFAPLDPITPVRKRGRNSASPTAESPTPSYLLQHPKRVRNAKPADQNLKGSASKNSGPFSP